MNSNDADAGVAPSELEFTVSGFISKPPAEVYEAIAAPETLSQYFTTGGARGRLETGATLTWDFADFPGAFPVEVVHATRPDEDGKEGRIVLTWGGDPAVTIEPGGTRVEFELRPVEGASRTEVRITERSWRNTAAGAQAAFGNCMGWTGMLAAMKAWLEYGVNLREGFYK